MDVNRTLEDIAKDRNTKKKGGQPTNAAKAGRGAGGRGGGRASRGGRGTGGRATRGRGSAGKSGGASAKIFGLAVQSSAAKVTGRGRGSGGRRSRGRGRGDARDVSVVARQPAQSYERDNASTIPSGQWSHDKFEGAVVRRGKGDLRSNLPNAKKTPLTTGAKVQVKNLGAGVTADDMKELFETIGPLKKGPEMNGRVCTAVFARKPHGDKFVEEYNGVELDGQPLNISVVKPKIPATGRLGNRVGQANRDVSFTIAL